MKRALGLARRLNLRLVLALALVASFLVVAPVKADNIVQGYKSQGDVQTGFLVALVKNNSDTVEAVPSNDSGRIFGVIVDPSLAPLTLNRQVNNQVFVATTGNYPVLVSTERGNIRLGDYLS